MSWVVPSAAALVVGGITFVSVQWLQCRFMCPPGLPMPPLDPGACAASTWMGALLWQHLSEIRKGSGVENLLQWARKYGNKPYVVRLLWRPYVVVSDARDVEEILTSVDGAFVKNTGYDVLRYLVGNGLLTMSDTAVHDAHRRIIAPVFRSQNVKVLCDTVVRSHALELLSELLALQRCTNYDGIVTLNIREILVRTVLGTATHVLLSTQLGRSELCVLSNAFEAITSVTPFNHIFRLYRTSRQREALQILDEFCAKALRQSEVGLGPDERYAFLVNVFQGGRHHLLSRYDSINHMKWILFGGHDTTSVALVYLFLHLARHADIQDALYKELATVMREPGTCPESAALLGCPLLVASVKEILRLCPSAPVVYRNAARDVFLSSSAVMIPTGSIVMLSILNVQRSTSIYGADADTFRPMRWIGPDGEALQRRVERNGYIPFSLGTRSCIGKELGLIEMLMMAAVVLRHLHLLPAGAIPDMHLSLTLSIRDHARLGIQVRDDVRRWKQGTTVTPTTTVVS